MTALHLERTHNVAGAEELYADLSARHPLAAARFAALRPHQAMDGWRRYTGRVNEAVAALQCYAIARESSASTSADRRSVIAPHTPLPNTHTVHMRPTVYGGYEH